MSAVLERLDMRSRQRMTPPSDPRPLLEFSGDLRLPDGPSVGNRWIPASEPSQRLWLEAVDSGKWRRFVVVAPTQRGKTLSAILSPTLWALAERRSSVAYAMPTLDKLTQNWDGKIKPAIEGTGYGSWLPTKGPGSKGGKPSVLTLRDPITKLVAGRIYFMASSGGGRETSTSSVSPAVVVFDEADDSENIGAIERVFRRSEAFGAGCLCFVASTVNNMPGREGHPILQQYAIGTQSRIGHRCPHCSNHVILELECMDMDAARITCPKCAVVWSEDDRHAALNAAVLIHKTPDSPFFSLLTVGIDYHWEIPDRKTGKVELLLPKIAAEYRRAKQAEARGDFSLMEVHINKVWCRHYEIPEADGEINNKTLATVSERSTYDKRMVPAWAHFLTMAQDVQGDRHYWLTVAHGADDRWAIVDWGYELLVPFGEDGKPLRAPTPADRRATLGLIRDKAEHGWQVEGGSRRMRPVQRGVDIGYLRDEIGAWIQGEPSWKAVRGVGYDEAGRRTSGRKLPLPDEIARTNSVSAAMPDGWYIYEWRVDGHMFRRAAHAALLRHADQPASGMLPRGLKANDALILHLSGEIWVEPKDGKDGYWREVRSRHDFLDCLIYAQALALVHRYMPDRRDDGDQMAPEPEETPAEESDWLKKTTTTTWRL